jgi:hypothetical protein
LIIASSRRQEAYATAEVAAEAADPTEEVAPATAEEAEEAALPSESVAVVGSASSETDPVEVAAGAGESPTAVLGTGTEA